jgi:hypothetical protein
MSHKLQEAAPRFLLPEASQKFRKFIYQYLDLAGLVKEFTGTGKMKYPLYRDF